MENNNITYINQWKKNKLLCATHRSLSPISKNQELQDTLFIFEDGEEFDDEEGLLTGMLIW